MTTSIFRFEGASTDDSGDLQTLKGYGYAGEELIGVHRVMPFGLGSNAPAGSHALALAARGQRTLVAALGLEMPAARQKNLPAGTAVLYDASGNVVFVKGQDGIQVEAKSGDIYVKPAQGKSLYHGGKPGDGSTFKRVMLEDGSASPNVYAKSG